MNSYEIYADYVALKKHFATFSYDYFMYRGKINVSIEAFEKRPDKNQFVKLHRKHKDPHNYLLANLIEKDRWIGDMTESIYLDWQRRNQSLMYLFGEQLNALSDDYKKAVLTQNPLPEIILAYFQRKLSVETLVIIIDTLGLWAYYNGIINPIWDVSSRLRKYAPFINPNKEIVKAKIIAKWHPN